MSAIHTIIFDFDGVFTDNKVWVDQNGKESVCCDRRDGLGLDMLRRSVAKGVLDAEVFVLSKEPNLVVGARAAKLKLPYYHGIADKLTFVREHLAKRFPEEPDPMSGLIYLGNDLNDLPIMRIAGFAVSPSDGHPLVKQVSHLVLDEKGGDGFVRAFVEQLLDVERFSEEELDELISDR